MDQRSYLIHVIKAVHVRAYPPSNVSRLWLLARLLNRLVVVFDRLHYAIFISLYDILKYGEISTQRSVFLKAINHPCEGYIGHGFEVAFFFAFLCRFLTRVVRASVNFDVNTMELALNQFLRFLICRAVDGPRGWREGAAMLVQCESVECVLDLRMNLGLVESIFFVEFGDINSVVIE